MDVTDARTSALREQMIVCLARTSPAPWGGRVLDDDGEPDPEAIAQLDALTQHHEAIGALRALDEVRQNVWRWHDVWHVRAEKIDMIVAAWRKRLAGEEP